MRDFGFEKNKVHFEGKGNFYRRKKKEAEFVENHRYLAKVRNGQGGFFPTGSTLCRSPNPFRSSPRILRFLSGSGKKKASPFLREARPFQPKNTR